MRVQLHVQARYAYFDHRNTNKTSNEQSDNDNEQSESLRLKRLIKISEPEKNKKTIFIWPEGIFYGTYLQNIKIYKKLFEENFSKNHLIILGINNFTDSLISDSRKYYNSSLNVNIINRF